MARTRVGLFLTKEEETKLEEWYASNEPGERFFVVKHTIDIVNELKEKVAGGREWWPKVTAGGLRFSWRPIG